MCDQYVSHRSLVHFAINVIFAWNMHAIFHKSFIIRSFQGRRQRGDACPCKSHQHLFFLSCRRYSGLGYRWPTFCYPPRLSFLGLATYSFAIVWGWAEIPSRTWFTTAHLCWRSMLDGYTNLSRACSSVNFPARTKHEHMYVTWQQRDARWPLQISISEHKLHGCIQNHSASQLCFGGKQRRPYRSP